MTDPWTIECRVHFQHAGHGQGKQVREGPKPDPAFPAGREPRVSRLMALALHLDEMLRAGTFASYAEVARLGHVTRARVCQIMNLVNLAPDIYSGGAAVSAAHEARPGSNHSGGFAADRGGARLATATTVMEATETS